MDEVLGCGGHEVSKEGLSEIKSILLPMWRTMPSKDGMLEWKSIYWMMRGDERSTHVLWRIGHCLSEVFIFYRIQRLLEGYWVYWMMRGDERSTHVLSDSTIA